MSFVRFSRYLSLWTIFAAMLWAAALAAQDNKAQEDKENTTLPTPYADGSKLNRHIQLNARVKQGNADLVFIGDSITQSWERAGKDVWKKFYDNRKAVDLGIDGDKTQNVLWRLEHGNVDGLSPKLAVVLIGTNNWGHNTPEQVAEGIQAIVAKLRTRLPETKVLVMGLFPRGEKANYSARPWMIKTNNLVAKLADDKAVFYLDIGPKLLSADSTLSKENSHDGLHVTEKGYQIWAESIEPTVAKLMGEKETLR